MKSTPDENAHLRKARSNKAFLETIDDRFADWPAIVAFYTAVHLIEALFAREGAPSHNHRQRNFFLKLRHPERWTHFRPLYNASKWLRYTDRTIDADRVRRELIRVRLASIEAVVYGGLEVRSGE